MPRRLSLLNVLLIGAGLVFAVVIARELTTSPPAAAPRPQPAATAGTAAAPAATPPPLAGGYTIIASRNLFSPTRSEAPVPASPPGPAPSLPKPNLYGVVLKDGTPLAYLEDPVTKRVAGYRIGDTIAGGTITTIADDNVMLARPEGQVAVRLHDPTRPRPAAPSTPLPPVGAPVSPTGMTFQGGPLRQSTPTLPPAPGGRLPRSLPPSVFGRIPSPQATDAPTTK